MAFALYKSSEGKALEEQKATRRSPLAGWLGKKPAGSGNANPAMPDLDVAAGVSRALKRASVQKSTFMQEDSVHSVRHALSVIEAALYAIDRVRDTLEQATEVVVNAQDSDDIGGRALLAETYDDLRLSINETIEKVDSRAAILLGKGQRHLDVHLCGNSRYSVSSIRLDVSDKGLNLAPPHDAFEENEEIEATLQQLDDALARADRAAASYCRDAQYLIARMKGEFTAQDAG